MAKKVGGLGKGLGAFGFNKTTSNKAAEKKPVEAPPKKSAPQTDAKAGFAQQPVMEIDLKLIKANPNQPRTEFDDEAMESLKDSVKHYGVLQPVLLRKTPKGYELIAGERRFRAAQLAGLKKIPALLREYNDAQMTEVALIENIQRENLNAMEEAQAYQHLLSDYGLTQDMLSKKIGRSRSHIANFLRLLKLSPKVQEMLVSGEISMGQAKPLLVLEDMALQEAAAEYIVENELSARKAEALAKQLEKHPDYLKNRAEANQAREHKPLDVFYLEAQDKLKLILGTKVQIKESGKRKKLEIEFSSQEELANVIELLEGRQSIAPAAQAEIDDKEAKLAKLRAFSTTGKLTV